MRKRLFFLVFGFILPVLSVWGAEKTSSDSIPIVPYPRNVFTKSGEFRVTGDTKLIVDPDFTSPKITAVKELQNAFQSQWGFAPGVLSATRPQGGSVFLGRLQSPTGRQWLKKSGFRLPAKFQKEGYILDISPKRVVVLAQSQAGLFYGAASLIQLIHASKNRALPALQLVDWPSLPFRGISDDMARGQVLTLRQMKKVVRFMALYKMNTYMPYLEDLLTSRHYPSIGKTRGRLTPREIRELQDYAKSYFVQIIPIFEMLGHCENILIQPQFRHLAEFPGAASLNPTSAAVDTFLRNLISDWAPQFDSPYFHAGLDESWDVGKGQSRIYVERYNTAVVHAAHYRKLYEMLKKQGKKMIMYGDIILRNPEIITQLPRDILIMDWHYGAASDYPSVEFFQRTGRKFLVSPGVSDWRRIFPDLTNAFANIQYLTQKGARYGALGSIVSTWGDYGGANFKELDWPAYAFAGACAWNPDNVRLERFRLHFGRQFYGCACPEISAVWDVLTKTAAGIQYRDIWRHPFAPTDNSSGQVLRRSIQCRNVAAELKGLIPKIRKRAKRHVAQLDYLAFAAELSGWYGKRLETVIWWKQLLHEYILPKERAHFKAEAARRFRARAAEIEQLSQEYQKLWVRANKRANLSLILRQFRREKIFWEIKAEEVEKGLYQTNPALPSQFIYYPTAADDQATVPLSFFRKTFRLQKKPVRGLLQVINAGVTQNYFNGKKLGESIARYANAMYVDSQRVQVYDVTRLTKRGENVLAFKAQSFDPRGKAGVNVYLWLKFKDGTTRVVLSDKYWKTADKFFKNWQALRFDDSDWYHTIVRPFRHFIPRPYFSHKMPSWID